MSRHRSLVPLASLALLLASACSSADRGATGPNAHTVSLSFSTKRPAGAIVAGGNQSSFLTLGTATDTIVITKAQVVLSKVELATADSVTCTTTDSSSECEELHADPELVDLPVDQSVMTALLTAIPAGTYTKFEAHVRLVKSTDVGGSAFLATHPEFSGVSIRVEGTFNGTPFVYTGTAGAELELEFAPPLVVDSTGMNITVNVDLSSWFMNGSGGLVDPATANSGGPNESLVAHNIHQSFEAFEDDNKDGHSDSQP